MLETEGEWKENSNEITRIRSELMTVLGKIAHRQDNYDLAYKYYHEATKLNATNYCAQFFLGQMYLNLRKNVEAEKCFESVIAEHARPDDFETLKVTDRQC